MRPLLTQGETWAQGSHWGNSGRRRGSWRSSGEEAVREEEVVGKTRALCWVGPQRASSCICRSSEMGVLLHYLLLYSPQPPPPHSLSQSLFLSLSLSGHANCSQGQSVGCAPPKHPPPPLPPSAPAPRFEWHVLIRPNLIGRRCLGWIGTALYSPLLLMCVDVCMCVRVRVMHVRLWSVCGWVHESVTRQRGSVFWGVSECVKGSVCKWWFMSWARVIFVYFSVKESLMCFDTAYGKCVGKYGLTWLEMLLVK